MSWRGIASAFLGLLFGLARISPALCAAPEPARVHLSMDRRSGAEQCQTIENLQLAVETRLRRPVFVARDRADLLVEISASRAGRRYVMRISLLDREGRRLGERRLETAARHCSALDDSLALVVSLAADVRRSEDPTPPELRPGGAKGEATTEAEPVSATIPRADAPRLSTPLLIPETTSAPRAPFAFQPSLGSAFALGLLPQLAWGAQARLVIVPPELWPLVVEGTLWRRQRLGRERGVHFSLQTLRVGVCPIQSGWKRWELSLCIDESVGVIRARGFGFDEDSPATHFWAALGAGGSARHPLGPLFLSGAASLLAPLVQRRYFYADEETVTLYRAPWLLGVAAVSVGIDL
jgi:hypothetical protein